jgi:subtilisin-like proprotein convertase family protein
VTPVAGQGGSATITVIVSDGSLSASNSFALSVVPLISVTNSFTNTAAITIPSLGSATPYPSVINVSNTVGNISNVTVTLRSMNHTWPADVDVLLVSPAGQKVIVFSDVGGSNDLNNVTVTLSDAAAAALSPTAQIVAGTFKPTNVEPGESGELDAFPTQSGPFASTMSAFNGVSANGAWSLYVVDDATGDLGNVASGWSLAITTVSSGLVPPTITNQPASQTISCGNNATLTVGVSGGTPLNYQWYFSNTLLAGKTNATLALNGAGGTNDGPYLVTVQNASGSVTSAPAVLTIIDTNAPLILTCATNLTLNAGVSCQAAIPNLMTQIVASDSCSSVTVTQSPAVGTLVGLGNTLVTLTVKDAANNQITCSATITVVDAVVPVITAHPQSLTNLIGTTAAFNVAGTACSSVSYQWMFGTNLLIGATNPTLTLTNIQPGIAGPYSAVLANSAGSSTSFVAVLTVLRPASPTVTSGPAKLGNGHFYVGFTGTPNVPYTIECATNIIGPWNSLTNVTSDTNGFIRVEDFSEPVPPTRFYRTVYP